MHALEEPTRATPLVPHDICVFIGLVATSRQELLSDPDSHAASAARLEELMRSELQAAN